MELRKLNFTIACLPCYCGSATYPPRLVEDDSLESSPQAHQPFCPSQPLIYPSLPATVKFPEHTSHHDQCEAYFHIHELKVRIYRCTYDGRFHGYLVSPCSSTLGLPSPRHTDFIDSLVLVLVSLAGKNTRGLLLATTLDWYRVATPNKCG